MSNPYEGDSNSLGVDGLTGKNTTAGNGVAGFSQHGIGVRGDNVDGFAAVHGHGGKNGVWGYTVSPNDSGVFGSNDGGGAGVAGFSQHGLGVLGGSTDGFAAVHGHGGKNGVWGYTVSPNDSGVFGSNDGGGAGVAGFSQHGLGVLGGSTDGFAAVHGHGGKNGVWGYTVSPNDSGVFGSHDGGGPGVAGFSQHGLGVLGGSTDGFAAVHGHGGKNGVWGYTVSPNDSGVFGSNDGSGGNGVAGYSQNGNGVYGFTQTGFAGFFQGNVNVTGDILLPGASDCAEHFDIAGAEQVEAGTVMSISDEGGLAPSRQPYDNRVAGVVSGAGKFKPGIILDKQGSEHSRLPIALLGKVYCKADAEFAPIRIGDLLTTSPTPGHAMKACDPRKAFGSVIGKALQPLATGQGLIPTLIALQ